MQALSMKTCLARPVVSSMLKAGGRRSSTDPIGADDPLEALGMVQRPSNEADGRSLPLPCSCRPPRPTLRGPPAALWPCTPAPGLCGPQVRAAEPIGMGSRVPLAGSEEQAGATFARGCHIHCHSPCTTALRTVVRPPVGHSAARKLQQQATSAAPCLPAGPIMATGLSTPTHFLPSTFWVLQVLSPPATSLASWQATTASTPWAW